VYHTSAGERILLGAERRLFEQSLAMMVDLLATGDCEFGVQVFDELQRGQKLFALYRAARGLLRPDEPPPELTAFLEGAVASVYRWALAMAIQEIEHPEFATANPSWRTLIIDAARECDDIDELPDAECRDREEWELLIECLEGAVLWDTDFEAQDRLDADPDTSRELDQFMGISANYYTAVAHDPPDDQINLYIDALMGLTPRGRGEFNTTDEDAESSNDAPF
jgi:hypothetical protein